MYKEIKKQSNTNTLVQKAKTSLILVCAIALILCVSVLSGCANRTLIILDFASILAVDMPLLQI